LGIPFFLNALYVIVAIHLIAHRLYAVHRFHIPDIDYIGDSQLGIQVKGQFGGKSEYMRAVPGKTQCCHYPLDIAHDCSSI
jgi:hypothetical protein